MDWVKVDSCSIILSVDKRSAIWLSLLAVQGWVSLISLGYAWRYSREQVWWHCVLGCGLQRWVLIRGDSVQVEFISLLVFRCKVGLGRNWTHFSVFLAHHLHLRLLIQWLLRRLLLHLLKVIVLLDVRCMLGNRSWLVHQDSMLVEEVVVWSLFFLFLQVSSSISKLPFVLHIEPGIDDSNFSWGWLISLHVFKFLSLLH